MELQELALKAVTCQLRYELSPRFLDVRGRFIEELTAEIELPEWGWGEDVLTFSNPDRALTLSRTWGEFLIVPPPFASAG